MLTSYFVFYLQQSCVLVCCGILPLLFKEKKSLTQTALASCVYTFSHGCQMPSSPVPRVLLSCINVFCKARKCRELMPVYCLWSPEIPLRGIFYKETLEDANPTGFANVTEAKGEVGSLGVVVSWHWPRWGGNNVSAQKFPAARRDFSVKCLTALAHDLILIIVRPKLINVIVMLDTSLYPVSPFPRSD